MIRNTVYLTTLLCILGFVASCANADNIKNRIQGKASLAQKRVQVLMSEGKDVGPIVGMMKQVPVMVKKKGPVAAEALLDKVLNKLDALENSDVDDGPGRLDKSRLFSQEKPVEMVGYDGHIMELFLSRDDQYLFFNNLNDPSVNTNIHYAKRIDVGRFQYIGEVKGVNTSALEGVPTLDENNNFYFISPRSYKKTHSTIYGGRYKEGVVQDLHIVSGNVNGRKPPIFNMGVEITADGQTLYYSEAIGRTGGGPPKDSDIKFGRKIGEEFVVSDDVDRIMKHINTPDEMEYAAAISLDELHIFFNRSKMLVQGNQTIGADLKILHARRNNKTEPFEKPKVLETIKGFVEGATITNDGNVLYYHKKNEKGVFRIYRVERL